MRQKEGTLTVSLIIIVEDRNQAQNIIFPLFLEHSQDCFPDQSPLFMPFLTVVDTFMTLFQEKFNVDLTELDNQDVTLSSFDLSPEEMTDALPLLYQSGYLTIKKYEPMFCQYTLGIPNKEVRDGLLNSMIPHSSQR